MKFKEKDWDLSEVEPPEEFPDLPLAPVEQGKVARPGKQQQQPAASGFLGASARCQVFLGVGSSTWDFAWVGEVFLFACLRPASPALNFKG